MAEKLTLVLRAMGAVLTEGSKWCGKTSTAEHVAESVLYMQAPDTSEENMMKAKTKPSLLLEGETHRVLIDDLTDALQDLEASEQDANLYASDFIRKLSIGDPTKITATSLSVLHRRLNQVDAASRLSLVQALGFLSRPESVPYLKNLADSPNLDLGEKWVRNFIKVAVLCNRDLFRAFYIKEFTMMVPSTRTECDYEKLALQVPVINFTW
ncbi:MAG: hypothetical protein LBN34_07300 [Clostridiales Family XIII bacterium]|jgi:hypothetical protein|nr:hypothetical protein [Clostridiales Family XIII bacterium]